MSLTKHERLHGWGYAPVTDCVSFRPEKRRDLDAIFARHHDSLLARGLGRSYGDAALNPAGTVRMERLDHIISFDAIEGVITAQAGVTLADIMNLAIPKGWICPVIPGTRMVTLGGAFACNVHGKNQFKEGDFAEHVLAIRLRLAGGEIIECSPVANSDIFWASAGGMGMTGIVEEVTLRLKRIGSSSLKTITYEVSALDDMIAAFEHYRNDADYMVGWIDHMEKDEVGRGIFEAAYHIGENTGGAHLARFKPMTPRFSVPFFMPPFVLNRYVMALYNKRRFGKYSLERKSEIVGFNGFFHPLDNIAHWNRLYGRRGFFQYQCMIPFAPDIADRLHAILTFLHQHRIFSFLAVLKYHRAGRSLISFSQNGFSLALDFPNTSRVRALLPQLSLWIAEHGGSVYLAKDALLSPELFNRMYPNAPAWREVLRDVDPDNRFASMMSHRLQWKEDAPHAA